MNSRTTRKFWEKFDALPRETQGRARRDYRKWKKNPNTAGLNFKRVSDKKPIYSVRIGRDYRAVGLLRGDRIVWYWIGHHDEYDRIIG